jgi:hypothetical protein
MNIIEQLHTNQQKQAELSLLPATAGFLLGSLFDPEDRGNMFLQNVGSLRTTWC